MRPPQVSVNLIHTLAPPNIAPVAEALIGLYIIIFSGEILGGANSIRRSTSLIASG